MDRAGFANGLKVSVLTLAKNEKWTDVAQCYEG